MTIDCNIVRDENGVWCADVPALPGCHTDGRTLDELRANLADAVALYLEDMAAEAAERSGRGAATRQFSFDIVPRTPRRRRAAGAPA